MSERKKWQAELILNGPKGFSYAEVQVPITLQGVLAAAAHSFYIYQEMPEPNTEGKMTKK